jgi:predicted restriction endonuclease
MNQDTEFKEGIVDPKLKKKFEKFLAKEAKKLSSKELAEIAVLQRKALSLWKSEVVRRAGKRCEVEGCKKTKYLNAHHIESYSTNKGLRFDPHNGICLCSTHHKFGRFSAHHSFCFMFNFMMVSRRDDLDYLLKHYQNKVEITKDSLKQIIAQLSPKPKLLKRKKV